MDVRCGDVVITRNNLHAVINGVTNLQNGLTHYTGTTDNGIECYWDSEGNYLPSIVFGGFLDHDLDVINWYTPVPQNGWVYYFEFKENKE